MLTLVRWFAGLTEISISTNRLSQLNGYAFGGGFAGAGGRFYVCADNASFALPEAKLGIVLTAAYAASAESCRLPSSMMVMTGDEWAQRGAALGDSQPRG